MPALKIAYLFQQSEFSLDANRGPVVHTRAIIDRLHQSGHQVTLLVLGPDRTVIGVEGTMESGAVRLGLTGNRSFKQFESAVRRGQKILRLPYLALFDSLRFYDACIHNLRGYDLIHERFSRLSTGGVRAASRLGIPFVLEVNADTLDEWDSIGRGRRGIPRLAERMASTVNFRRASAIIAVSNPLKTHLIQSWGLPAGKIIVLPNGADLNRFKPEVDPRAARSRLGLPEAPTVIFVSGFYPWHATLELIDSFARVHRQLPEARLYMVGDGQIRRESERYAGEMGLGGVVHFQGVVPHDNIPDWLAAADVAVMPYPKLSKELWFSPLKMYEYMAAGKAIVASGDGQIAEVIHDGFNGVLVEPGDIDGFARHMVRLLQDEGERKRLGFNARLQAVEKHSWDGYVSRLERIYENVLGSNRAVNPPH